MEGDIGARANKKHKIVHRMGRPKFFRNQMPNILIWSSGLKQQFAKSSHEK